MASSSRMWVWALAAVAAALLLLWIWSGGGDDDSPVASQTPDSSSSPAPAAAVNPTVEKRQSSGSVEPSSGAPRTPEHPGPSAPNSESARPVEMVEERIEEEVLEPSGESGPVRPKLMTEAAMKEEAVKLEQAQIVLLRGAPPMAPENRITITPEQQKQLERNLDHLETPQDLIDALSNPRFTEEELKALRKAANPPPLTPEQQEMVDNALRGFGIQDAP